MYVKLCMIGYPPLVPVPLDPAPTTNPPRGVSDVPWSVLNDSQGVFLSVDAGVWSLSLARLLLLAFKPSLLPLLPPLRPTDKRVEEANGSNPRAV